MENSLKEITGDFRVVSDPVLQEFEGHDVCIFHVVDVDTDTADWTDNDILTRSKRVYERGGHAKASYTYLEVNSICNITGNTGQKDAVDLHGNKYTQECIVSFNTQFKSYPKKLTNIRNQQLFDAL